MEQFILIFHFVIAVALIGLILIQQGKGAEAGASFGAGASQTVFGSAGGWNFFSKTTALLATVFFVTSVSLAIVAKNRTVVADVLLPELQQVPVEVATESTIPELESEAETQLPVVDESEIPTQD
jgi:preprotein translocase subunit SecG